MRALTRRMCGGGGRWRVNVAWWRHSGISIDGDDGGDTMVVSMLLVMRHRIGAAAPCSMVVSMLVVMLEMDCW